MKTAFDRFSAGEQGAAAEVIAEYGPTAYAAAFGVLRDAGRAEELAAEVIADALRNPVDLGGSREVAALWIAAAVRRRALAAHRESVRKKRAGRSDRGTGLGPDDTAWEWLLSGLTAERVCAALHELRPPLREAATLAYLNGMGPADLARRTGISEDRARDRLRSALIELQDTLVAASGEVVL